MKILRVFPRKTNMSPADDLVAFGEPGLFRPEADEVHISTVFTWDIPRSEYLKKCWEVYYPVVRVGGPAFGDPGGEFVPGRYIKKGVTITSRGCSNICPFCLVPKREGFLRELEVKPGNIVQDNNLLACTTGHLNEVFEMLSAQKGIEFKGGIDASMINDWFIEKIWELRIRSIWVACDSDEELRSLRHAISFLGHWEHRKLNCYTLCAYKGQTVFEAEERLREVYKIGFLPYAQLYQPDDKYIEYSKEWKDLQRNWTRPAIIKARMKEVAMKRAVTEISNF